MAAPDAVRDLVTRFKDGLAGYRSTTYKEARVRIDFINPLFEVLGWDISNEKGKLEAQRDVITEYAQRIGGTVKAPDYCFRIGGDNRFFVEAKQPAVNIANAPGPALQLRSYAWSAQLPVSILTDFEEFAVYDCRVAPEANDKATASRPFYFQFDEYLSKWDEIDKLFSYEAVLNGSLEQFASQKLPRNATPVDVAFLKEIEGWRAELARNVAINNPQLSVANLNYAVQMTLDRLIFLRICEDRNIEVGGQLLGLTNGAAIYDRLRQLFRRADARYNSGLFHFDEERGREEPDELTLNLKIDDTPLRNIITHLYYPTSPYIFNVIPVEILGQVYEQFLGRVITVSGSGTGRKVEVEEKPEVRKAGGVFYTPKYIVDYIVAHTVGELLKHKTPKQAASLKILDPACGSGSFLLGAYGYLLNWHLHWYREHEPQKHGKQVFQVSKDEWRLTTEEKKRILRNNIYGVDVDQQAVEVTKLSLLLKVLEGETDQSIAQQLSFFHERALPDLSDNIKCGNSLIGPEFNITQLPLITSDEREKAESRVNAFDWAGSDGFAEIMKAGGFDAVIGNPPYIRIQTMMDEPGGRETLDYYKQHYAAANRGNYDIYVIFVEKGLALLNQRGRLGYILPHKFFNAKYGEPLRGLLAQGRHLAEVVHFGDQQVFDNATTYTTLLFLDKSGRDSVEVTKVSDLAAWRKKGKAATGVIPASSISAAEWNFSVGSGSALFDRLSKMPVKLGDIASRMYQGPITSADTVYLFKQYTLQEDSTTVVLSQELGDWFKIESVMLKPVVRSGSIHRYEAVPTAQVLFPYEVINNKARLYSPEEMAHNYPLAWEYLNRNKKLLEDREGGKFRDAQWYRFGRNQNIGMWEQPKLMIPYMITELAAYLDNADDYYFINVTTGGYGITIKQADASLAYLCGLLNSRLLDFYLKQVSTNFHGGYFAANKQFIEQLPIRTLERSKPDEKVQHDQIVVLVERMLSLHQRLAEAHTAPERTPLQRQIEATDKEIDRLVYELYGLTAEEIKIVETATKGY
ncbi:MAG: restriction endonuclease subunit M [Candidatus Chloroheliales bacterium]|nr:MAG: restriction endonuclease subunit M [Chloroflexota bacterium]